MTPILGLPPTATQRVRPHLHKTTGYAAASGGDCLKIARQEAKVPHRAFVAVAIKNLANTIPPQGSWFLGILLCPGDATDEVAAWASTRKSDLARVRFYFRTGVDQVPAMRAWVQAGLPEPLYEEDIDAWPRFHHFFGAHHAIQVYRDHVPQPPAGLSNP